MVLLWHLWVKKSTAIFWEDSEISCPPHLFLQLGQAGFQNTLQLTGTPTVKTPCSSQGSCIFLYALCLWEPRNSKASSPLAESPQGRLASFGKRITWELRNPSRTLGDRSHILLHLWKQLVPQPREACLLQRKRQLCLSEDAKHIGLVLML